MSEVPSGAPPAPQQTYTYYHAGPLFSMGELHTNVLLSTAITSLSNGKFVPLLPQDIELRSVTPRSIRDQDLRTLLNADLALFTFDGTELDAGTVVEYMTAKFADIPTVIFRSDFRGGGDQGAGGQPWNLMVSNWPRSVGVVVDAMAEYKTALSVLTAATLQGQTNGFQTAGEVVIEKAARKIVDGFDEVLRTPAKMPKELREHVFRWIALMPGYEDGEEGEQEVMLNALKVKEERGLFQ